jgi:hypothetical protein
VTSVHARATARSGVGGETAALLLEMNGPRRRTGRFALLAVGAVVLLGTAAFTAFKLTRKAEQEIAGPSKTLSVDEGELNLIAVVPATIGLGSDTEIHLAVHNKLGQPVANDSAVVVLIDPQKAERGYQAESQGEPGHYHFHHTFEKAGRYVVRLFTSPPDTQFDLELEVGE